MKTVYISGPMRNLPRFNFPAFDAAAEKLRSKGWGVISPAEVDRAHNPNIEFLPPVSVDRAFLNRAAIRDAVALTECDAIYMLRGWEKSKGASAEIAIANWLGLEIMYETEGAPEISVKPKIIAFTGKAGSGKNFAASMLPDVDDSGSWKEIAFAGPLKSMLSVLFSALAHSRRASMMCLDGFGQPPKEEEIPYLGKSPRQMMQTLGTEWGRQMVCDDLWIQCFRAGVDRIRECDPECNIVVTDLRLPNEEACIREMGGTIIHIVRSARKDVAAHASENQAIFADHVIYNDGSPEELKEKLAAIIGGLN